MPLIEITTNNDCSRLTELMTKDRVIIFYYMRGCIFCDRLMITFNDVVAENRELIQDANIFKIETANMHLLPDKLRDVRGFPYILSYFKYKQDEEPQLNAFNADRTGENIKKYISENNSKLSTITERSLPRASTEPRRIKKLKSYSTPKRTTI